MSSDDAAILLSAGLKFVVLLSGAANPRREPPPVLQTSIGPFNPTEQLDGPATQPDTPQPPSSKRADFASSRSRITGGAGGPLSTPISRSDGNIGGDTPGSAAPAAEVMSENASPQISGQGLDVPLFAAEVVCATDVFSSLSQECVTVVLSSLRSGLVDECAESAVSLLASAPSLPDSLWLALRRLNPLLVQADHHFAQPPVLPDTSNGNDPPASITSSQPFALSEPTGPSVKSPVRSPPARSSSSYPLAEEDVGPAIDSSLHRICSLAILPTPSGSSVVRGGMSSPQDSPRLGSLGQVTPLPSDLSLTPNRHSRKQSGEDGLRTRTNSTVASQRSGVEGRASQLGGELDNSDTDSHTTVYEEGDLADLASPMFSDDTGLQKTDGGRDVSSDPECEPRVCNGLLAIECLGLLFSGGMPTVWLNRMLSLLHPARSLPPPWRFQALCALTSVASAGVARARVHARPPPAYFSFARRTQPSSQMGKPTAITLRNVAWPFVREYLVTFRFRARQFGGPAPPPASSNGIPLSATPAATLTTSKTAGKTGSTPQLPPPHKGSSLLSIRGGDTGSGVFDMSAAPGHFYLRCESVVGSWSEVDVRCDAIQAGRWVSITIHHTKPYLIGRSEVKVTVDGQQVSQALEFPPFPPDSSPEILVGSGLDGEVSPVYFFKEAVSEEVVSELFSGQMVDTCPPVLTSSAGSVILSKLWCQLHPAHVYGTMLQDVVGRSGVTGFLSGSVLPWCHRNIRDTIGCVGGVVSLLPVVSTLASIVASKLEAVPAGSPLLRTSVDRRSPAGGRNMCELNWTAVCGATGEHAHKSPVTLFLQLLSALIQDHPRNARDAASSNFFELLTLTLSQQGHAAITFNCKSLVSTLLDLAGCAAIHPPLYSQVWRMITWLPNFGHSPVWIVKELIESLVQVLRAKPDYFRSTIGFHRMLDGIVEFATLICSTFANAADTTLQSSFHSPNRTLFTIGRGSVNPFSSPLPDEDMTSPHRNAGSKSSEVYEILHMAVRALACLMGGSACEAFGLQSMSTLSASAVDIEDIQALMHTVSSCNNSAVKAAVLSLLAELLIHESSLPKMIGVFDGLESVTSGSFLPFIIFGVMTSSRDDNVCAAALTALAHYMFADNARPKSVSLGTFLRRVAAGVAKSGHQESAAMAMSAKWALPLAELSGSAVLARVFGESGLGDITYTVFKRLMMLKDPVAASTPVDRFSDARRRASSLLRLDLSGLLDVDNQAIAVPMFLDALFKLIPTLQGDMLQTFMMDLDCLVKHPYNRKVVYQAVPCWESLLLTASFKCPPTLNADSVPVNLPYDIVSSLILHAQTVEPEGLGNTLGWPSMFRIISACRTDRERGTVRRLLCSVLDECVMHSEPSPTHAYNIAHITFGVAAALDHDMHADDSTVWLFEPLVPTPLPSAQQHGSVQPFSDVDSNRSPFTDGDDSAESRNNSVSFDISDVTDEAPSNEGALIPPVALDPRLRSSPHRLDRIAMRNASLTVRVTEGVSVTPPKLPQSLPQGSPQLMQSPPSLEPQTPQKDRAGSSLGEPRDHTSADVALAVLNCWDRLLVEFDADALLPSPVQGPWTSNLPCTFAHALLRVSCWLLDRLPADSPRAPKVIVRLKQCVGVLLASLDAESRCGTVIESAESMRAANQGRSRSRSGSAGFSTPLSDVTPSPMATPSVANAKQWILFVMWYCHELLRKVTAKLQSSAEGSGVPDPGSLIATVTAVARGVVDILSLIAAVAPAVFASSTFDESTLRLFIRTIVTASNFNIRPVRVSSVDDDGVTEREEVDDPTDSPLATAAAAGGCVILPYWMSHTWLSQPAWVSDVPAAVSAVLCSFDVWTDATSALRAAFVNEQSSNVTAGPSMPPLSSLGDSWVKAESEGVALLNTMSLHDMQRWSVSNSQREDESQLSLKRYRRLLKCVQTPRGVWDTYWCDVIRWKMCVELDGKKRRLFLRRNFGHSDFSSAEYCHEPEAATSDPPAAPTTIAKLLIRPNREDIDLMLDSSQPASAAAGGPPTGGVNTAFPASQLRVMRPRGDTGTLRKNSVIFDDLESIAFDDGASVARTVTLSVSLTLPDTATVKGPLNLLQGEKIVVSMPAKVISTSRQSRGKLTLSSEFLYFEPTGDALDESGPRTSKPGAKAPPTPLTSSSSKSSSYSSLDDMTSKASNASVFDADVGTASHLSSLPKQSCKRWPLRLLTAAAQRRYLLRRCALELFFQDGRTVFLCFEDPKSASRVLHALVNGNYPMFDSVRSQSAAKQLSSLKLTERWKRRELSNFDYLLELNMLASRSYNDITQYPVFPWILTNYTTRCLDLNSPSNYRDLSFPIGALSESQRDSLIDRFESFPDTSIPFHYGTHYSSHTLVCYYLLRLQPFTGLHVDVQGGRFDCPDRLFHSVDEAWTSCTSTTSDVKELIPEFYCFPPFLANVDDLPLGTRVDGSAVHDVVLPAWAQSPEEFVWWHRRALESEYVSANLHHWIDLIFGYKQTGAEAIKAYNVFNSSSYEEYVDPADMNPSLAEESAKHFGQTPAQLFTSPHPQRLPAYSCPLPLFHDLLHPTVARGSDSSQVSDNQDLASALCVTTTASEGVPRGDSGVFLSPVSSSFKASTPLSIDGASLAAQMGTPVVTVKVAFDGGADKLILPSIDERLSTFETLFDDDESDAEGDDDEKEASTSTGGKPVSADFVLIPPPPARSAVPSLPDKRSPLDITPCLASYPFPTHKGAPYPMFISSLGDHIVILFEDLTLSSHKWDSTPSGGVPFNLKPAKRKALLSSRLHTAGIRPTAASASPFVVGIHGSCFGCIVPHTGTKRHTSADGLLLSVGYADGGIRWQNFEGKRFGTYLPTGDGYGSAICLTVSSDNTSFVTGHSDGSAHLWELLPLSFGAPSRCCESTLPVQPSEVLPGSLSQHALYHLGTITGQHTAVSSVAISSCLGVILTGSRDGVIIVTSIRKLRTLSAIHCGTPDEACAITGLHISDAHCRILVTLLRKSTTSPTSAPVQSIRVLSLDGSVLASVDSSCPVICAHLTASGDFLLVGDASGAVSVLSVGDLSVVLVHKLGAPGAALSPMASPPAVQCVVMAEGDKHMLVACELSPLMVVTDPILVSKPQPK